MNILPKDVSSGSSWPPAFSPVAGTGQSSTSQTGDGQPGNGRAEARDSEAGHPGQGLLDIQKARALMKSGRMVIVSLAPSFPAAFSDIGPMKVVSALRSLGFFRIEETACALGRIIEERARILRESAGSLISTSCPGVVELIYQSYPWAVPLLMPLPSPMRAHGALLKEKYGQEAAIVFIGPCLLKKQERDVGTEKRAIAGETVVDVCLTFAELHSWLMEEGISLAALPDGKLDCEAPFHARLGVLYDGISGIENCRAFLERLGSPARLPFVELLACKGGCLNGPGMEIPGMHPAEEHHAKKAWLERLEVRRKKIIEHASTRIS